LAYIPRTADLKAASDDGHAWVRFDPAQYAAAAQLAGSETGEEAFWRRHAIRSQHGLKAMRVLPGNLRYFWISGFEWVHRNE